MSQELDAAVAYHQYELDAAQRAVEGTKAKATKARAFVDVCDADYENALVELEAAEKRVDDASTRAAEARAAEADEARDVEEPTSDLQSAGAAAALDATVKVD